MEGGVDIFLEIQRLLLGEWAYLKIRLIFAPTQKCSFIGVTAKRLGLTALKKQPWVKQ